jgi:predicted RNA-binding Zn-ribbon protein involved in translation (DUF1610 family)
LDDKSHQRPDRQERDMFVDQVFKAARLPILHVPVKRAYVTAEIEAQIAPYLSAETTPQKQEFNPVSVSKVELTKTAISGDSAPTCPKCGSTMILRTAKSGASAGNRFWGCSTYLTCRSMLPYQEE